MTQINRWFVRAVTILVFVMIALSVFSRHALADYTYEPTEASAYKLTVDEAVQTLNTYMEQCKYALDDSKPNVHGRAQIRSDYIILITPEYSSPDPSMASPSETQFYRFSEIRKIALTYTSYFLGTEWAEIKVWSGSNPEGKLLEKSFVCQAGKNNVWVNESAYKFADALLRLKIEYGRSLASAEEKFHEAVASYHAANPKPELPEEARKFKIQAEGAIRDNDFEGAASLYGQAVDIAPWWPEGHFNRALVLGEVKEYSLAIVEMKRYLLLNPNAPDARAAQDKIYDWERKTR